MGGAPASLVSGGGHGAFPLGEISPHGQVGEARGFRAPSGGNFPGTGPQKFVGSGGMPEVRMGAHRFADTKDGRMHGYSYAKQGQPDANDYINPDGTFTDNMEVRDAGGPASKGQPFFSGRNDELFFDELGNAAPVAPGVNVPQQNGVVVTPEQLTGQVASYKPIPAYDYAAPKTVMYDGPEQPAAKAPSLWDDIKTYFAPQEIKKALSWDNWKKEVPALDVKVPEAPQFLADVATNARNNFAGSVLGRAFGVASAPTPAAAAVAADPPIVLSAKRPVTAADAGLSAGPQDVIAHADGSMPSPVSVLQSRFENLLSGPSALATAAATPTAPPTTTSPAHHSIVNAFTVGAPLEKEAAYAWAKRLVGTSKAFPEDKGLAEQAQQAVQWAAMTPTQRKAALDYGEKQVNWAKGQQVVAEQNPSKTGIPSQEQSLWEDLKHFNSTGRLPVHAEVGPFANTRRIDSPYGTGYAVDNGKPPAVDPLWGGAGIFYDRYGMHSIADVRREGADHAMPRRNTHRTKS